MAASDEVLGGDSRPCCKLRLIKRDLIRGAGCGVGAAAGGQFSANRHLSGPACKGYANYPAGIIQHRRAGSSPLRELKPGVSHANASRSKWLRRCVVSGSKEDTQ